MPSSTFWGFQHLQKHENKHKKAEWSGDKKGGCSTELACLVVECFWEGNGCSAQQPKGLAKEQ